MKHIHKTITPYKLQKRQRPVPRAPWAVHAENEAAQGVELSRDGLHLQSELLIALANHRGPLLLLGLLQFGNGSVALSGNAVDLSHFRELGRSQFGGELTPPMRLFHFANST